MYPKIDQFGFSLLEEKRVSNTTAIVPLEGKPNADECNGTVAPILSN